MGDGFNFLLIYRLIRSTFRWITLSVSSRKEGENKKLLYPLYEAERVDKRSNAG